MACTIGFLTSFFDNFMESDEDGAEVCVVLRGPTSVDIPVRLVTSDGTAIGESEQA